MSLSSVGCNMSERVIKKQWTKSLQDHKLTSNSQFGLRKGCSCAMNLLSSYSIVVEKIQERGGWVNCVYLDLKTAFNKILPMTVI